MVWTGTLMIITRQATVMLAMIILAITIMSTKASQ